ncbi:hypothetical protein [Bradyrhizobium sp. AT1]|uniref:hypothetical protein n=1 Tax=Bradyrhizobium sp. AT1 TaxID=574934 RepID=UPI000A755DEA|nr:hypothetical protein [Bradyrhizobium sp. AT1]
MLEHGEKSFHSAESDASDLTKSAAKFLFVPARQGGSFALTAKKGPALRGLPCRV